ncbi:gamma-glutamylcyclotransferase [Aromatoleum bremense]|uniref:glutathione-specific gamma-glutamylcyclotransferase n=1 Tax=Aromatoleum bremense TaxID=76115 RepID=A0ABX1NZY0_9RHOO|nr:gamma-glutamylcyclotransferase [Aromatoleum bremense]NMG17599.1 gamma-glutamylcyclotransferase [Aromatoleum bremense]QTQ34154.1 Gamma-glutamylcyclotransferase [Aromatoleum bremense]
MTILTRKNLIDGSFRGSLDMPSHLSRSDADLDRSLDEILQARPDGAIWVFAYGSLIWNPLLAFAEQCTATLDGWHRSFCVRSISGRGRLEWPGRVLALEPDGQVQGVALRLNDDQAAAELRLLWTREMGSGVYRPLWSQVTLGDGREVAAIVFVVNPEQPLYEPDATVATVARIVVEAAGVFGRNADYLHALDAALADRGLRDPYIDAIVCALTRGKDGTPQPAQIAPPPV